MDTRHRSRRTVGLLVTFGLLGACSHATTTSAGMPATGISVPKTASQNKLTSKGTLFDTSKVHDMKVTYAQADFDAMLATFKSAGTKEWLHATVTIDGLTFQDVGIRLKGNSTLMSLRGVGGFPGGGAGGFPTDAAGGFPADAAGGFPAGGFPTDAAGGFPAGGFPAGGFPAGGFPGGGPGGNVSADKPESLPWLVKLNKFVKGQNYAGSKEIVVRANSSQTSLNEAVALELTGLALAATERAASTRFTVNGGSTDLRLVIENPDDNWNEDNFANPGVLYKADASGDYSYRGDDPAKYAGVFKQESNGSVPELTPLIQFLKFINESDDATFAAELSKHLEINEFARYLAMQTVINNFDDIQGPGNNSFLRFDERTKRMTVVSWDLNLAFGSSPGGPGGFGGGGGFGGFAGGGGRPGGAFGGRQPAGGPVGGNGATPANADAGATPPAGRGAPPAGAVPGGRPGGFGGAGGPGFGKSNILVTRFKANATFNALFEQAKLDLKAELYTNGKAQAILDRWAKVLTDQAGDLVDAATIDTESKAVAKGFV